MSTNLSLEEFRLLQKYIMKHSGILIPEEKAYLMQSRLTAILKTYDLKNYYELYKMLTRDHNSSLAEEVVDAVTINETHWFRDDTPWNVLEHILIPKYLKEFEEGNRKRVRIWSAGCSTGQEAYSIAMCIRNFLELHAINPKKYLFEILATDISHSALKAARKGIYDSLSIKRGLSDTYKNRYMHHREPLWVVNDAIRDWISFKYFNLLESFLLLGKFDIIFCRYVAIYFQQKNKSELFKKIAASLEPNGILFLGNSEIFSECHTGFAKEEYREGIYYRRS